MTQSALRLVTKEDGDKQRALEAALAQIDRAFGKGSVMKLGDKGKVVEIESVSTGSLGLDMALGIGGLPKGRIVEIYGPESSGKTTLALHVVAEAQRKGGACAFVLSIAPPSTTRSVLLCAIALLLYGRDSPGQQSPGRRPGRDVAAMYTICSVFAICSF